MHKIGFIGPGLSEGPHVEQIPAGEVFHRGELGTQICGKSIQHFRAPALLRLPVQDRAPDAPPQLQELVADLPLRLRACGAHVLLEAFERGGVVVGHQITTPRSRTTSSTTADVRASLDGRIARCKIPKHVVVVDELPRTTAGKVRKADLRLRFTRPSPRVERARVRATARCHRARPSCVLSIT
ncbi:hypothetical protein QFZ21_003838 [Microbacterium sp. W4I20]|nr:hypothetical protein [Microbacterium sp. W4I20]MDQ0728838.1 hypothetical protein [Microbacterium sp. W4I20]